MRQNIRMLRPSLPAFFDELEKISGELIEPAVVANSDAVSGPPATPFAQRRGYKKLERTLEKDAGLGEDFRRWRRKAQVAAGRTSQAATNASIKVYTALPGPVQKAVTNPTLTDPSDPSGGIALKGIKTILGGG